MHGMDYGLRFKWISGGLPFGGDCHLYDDHGELVWLLDRDAFVEDPDGFMDSLERHGDANTKGHGWRLSLPVAVGDGRSPVPSRHAKTHRRLTSVALLPLTGCAWIAAGATHLAGTGVLGV